MGRYLLIGGGGFLGANLALELAGSGHAVTVCSPGPSRHGAALAAAGVHEERAALADLPRLHALFERDACNAVIHLASTLIPSSNHEAYLAEREAILEPTIRLAASLAERGIPLVYVSSGGTVYGANPAAVLTEDLPCAPISLYGQAKVETEEAIRLLGRTRGLDYLIVRPSNPYGRFQRLDGPQGLISVVLGAVRDKRTLQVWGDGKGLRDYIYIADFCAAMRSLLEQRITGQTLNIGSGTGHSLLDVVATVEQVTGRQVPLAFHPARSVDVPNVVLGTAALRAHGAWQTRPLEQGIRLYAREIGLVGA